MCLIASSLFIATINNNPCDPRPHAPPGLRIDCDEDGGCTCDATIIIIAVLGHRSSPRCPRSKGRRSSSSKPAGVLAKARLARTTVSNFRNAYSSLRRGNNSWKRGAETLPSASLSSFIFLVVDVFFPIRQSPELTNQGFRGNVRSALKPIYSDNDNDNSKIVIDTSSFVCLFDHDIEVISF